MPAKQVSDRGLCIATFQRARNFYKRFIGLKWKSWLRWSESSRKPCRRSKRCERGYCLFVDAIETKQIIAPALNTLIGDPKKVFAASYALMQEAIRALVQRAIKNGDIRKDVEPMDLLRALVGVAHVATSPDWQQSARRLVDILIAGSRPIK